MPRLLVWSALAAAGLWLAAFLAGLVGFDGLSGALKLPGVQGGSRSGERPVPSGARLARPASRPRAAVDPGTRVQRPHRVLTPPAPRTRVPTRVPSSGLAPRVSTRHSYLPTSRGRSAYTPAAARPQSGGTTTNNGRTTPPGQQRTTTPGGRPIPHRSPGG
jgi:hypothetical protein